MKPNQSSIVASNREAPKGIQRLVAASNSYLEAVEIHFSDYPSHAVLDEFERRSASVDDYTVRQGANRFFLSVRVNLPHEDMLLTIPLKARLAVQYYILEASTVELSEASELEEFLLQHLLPNPFAEAYQPPLRDEPRGTRFPGSRRRYAENRYWLSVNTRGRVTAMPCCRIEWRFKGWEYPEFAAVNHRSAWGGALALAEGALTDLELGRVWESHRRVQSHRGRRPETPSDFERVGRVVRRRAAYGEKGVCSPHNLVALLGKYTTGEAGPLFEGLDNDFLLPSSEDALWLRRRKSEHR